MGQLQELDRQICDLRLDAEESDSRPSSGNRAGLERIRWRLVGSAGFNVVFTG